jgi:hypothetical protein
VATRQTSGTRAKDSDRNDTCQILDSAVSEGQLSMEEHRERVRAATTATTLGELQSLVSDLQNSNAPVQLPELKKPRGQGGGWGMRAAVAGVLRGAPETLDIKPADVTSTYLNIDPASDPTTPGALEVSIYVSSDYGSGYIEMDGAGNIKNISYPNNS